MGALGPRMVRALVFHVEPGLVPHSLLAFPPEYRRMVNEAIRAGLAANATSRASLNRVAYAPLASAHPGRSTYVVQAIADALAILHSHRKRQRRGHVSRPPFVGRLYLKVAAPSFHFDDGTGNMRVSVGNGLWVMFRLPVSAWHREQVRAEGTRPVLLTIRPGQVTMIMARDAPPPFEPVAVLALDTNETSLDGVLAAGGESMRVHVPFDQIRAVQGRHFVRRRMLSAKKAHDRRVQRRLVGREGKRESDRVRNRLHALSKSLLKAALERRAAVVLEDLTGIRTFFSPRLNRRLSAWPHRELHRQIVYKAQAAGVPVTFVNPYLTSQRCAMCGWTPKRSNARTSARRADGMYVCGNPECTWRENRQFNAGINILRTALTERPGLGGVRFHLDALSRDVMNPLYAPAPRAARGERMERESQSAASAVARPTAPAATGP